MDVYLVDGTYELFRHFFAVPPTADVNGMEVGAVRGVLSSIIGLIDGGATHIGVATDHIIESFRNELYAGYKTSAGMPGELLAQFPLFEEALTSMGVLVWPEIEFEADDALAAAAAKADADDRVGRVFICTPDKDLGQSVRGDRVVQLDRRRNILRNEAGVVEKFGVRPESIPEYLAVVGDSADGYPGLQGWGPKAAALTFSKFPHFEDVPRDWRQWDRGLRGAERLAATFFDNWDDALLYRTLATLRLDVPVFESVDELEWKGPTAGFLAMCDRLQMDAMSARAAAISRARGF